jgi:hypothetical protein
LLNDWSKADAVARPELAEEQSGFRDLALVNRYCLEAVVRLCWVSSLSVASEALSPKQRDCSLVGLRVALPYNSEASIAKD